MHVSRQIRGCPTNPKRASRRHSIKFFRGPSGIALSRQQPRTTFKTRWQRSWSKADFYESRGKVWGVLRHIPPESHQRIDQPGVSDEGPSREWRSDCNLRISSRRQALNRGRPDCELCYAEGDGGRRVSGLRSVRQSGLVPKRCLSQSGTWIRRRLGFCKCDSKQLRSSIQKTSKVRACSR